MNSKPSTGRLRLSIIALLASMMMVSFADDKSGPGATPFVANNRILWSGAILGLSAFVAAVWLLRRRRRPAAVESATLFDPLLTAIVSPQPDSQNVAKISTGETAIHSGLRTDLADASSWEKRAMEAEHRADRVVAAVRSGLMPHLARLMKDRLLRKLATQRSQLLNTQQSSARMVAELEQRLALVQAQFQTRVQSYERRIAELERELAANDRINREVPGAKDQTKHETPETVKSPGATFLDS